MPTVTIPPPARNMTGEEVSRAAEQARCAVDRWRRCSLSQRIGSLRGVWSEIYARREELASVLHSETGKPLVEIQTTEVVPAGLIVKYFTSNAHRILQDRPASKPWAMFNKRAYVHFVPRGVIGLVTPWNFPFMIPFGDSVPAMLAGNAVLVKPSEWASRTMLWAADAVRSTGLLPEGLFSVVTGDGSVGRQVIDLTDMVLFTGSTRTGKAVAKDAGGQLKPAVLELGGKHPMIVFKDASVPRAAKAAVWGAFANSGQACVGVERVYVEEEIHDAFVDAVRRETEPLRQGLDGTDVDLGRLIFPPQFERVMDQLEDARAKGATVIGGEVLDAGNLMISPALVLGATSEMKVMSEETFGPVIPIMKVTRGEDAIRLSNEGPFGLAASLWTADIAKAERLARSVEAGMVGINDLMSHYALASLPFGGVKSSGLGRRHSEEGMRMFCAPQSVLIHEWPAASPDPWWFPYDRFKAELAHWFLRLS